MIAFKGLQKDLTCLGFQFRKHIVNQTEKANCTKNGFHCAENPLDCLSYYRNWEDSVYYMVEATGDLDEDGTDSKISCTRLRLLKKLDLENFLLQSMVYMAKYPKREWNPHVHRENGKAEDRFVVVRGKAPKACGKSETFLAILKEKADSEDIAEMALLHVDGDRWKPGVWYDVSGKELGHGYRADRAKKSQFAERKK